MNDKLATIANLELSIEKKKALLAKLQADVQQLRDEVKHEEIEKLEEHIAHAEVKLSNIRDVAEEAWHEFVEAIEHSWDNMSDWVKEQWDDFHHEEK